MKLVTDFYDYYDHWFNNNSKKEKIFKRLSNDKTFSRKEMFEYLNSNNIRTVHYGLVKDIAKEYRADRRVLVEVVVYIDEYAHKGEGKCKMPLNVANCLYPNHLCSRYYFNYSTSYRHLQIGNKAFWLCYMNKNRSDWRSNYGDAFIKILETDKNTYSLKKYPLFAIDFLEIFDKETEYCSKTYVAMDFNISPQIRGTGIEDILSAKKVFDYIKDFKG